MIQNFTPVPNSITTPSGTVIPYQYCFISLLIYFTVSIFEV